MLILEAEYPKLFKMFQLLYEDNWGHGNFRFFWIPDTYEAPELSAMDNKLNALSEEELQTFGQGEITSVEKIISKYGIEDIQTLLNDIFEDHMDVTIRLNKETVKGWKLDRLYVEIEGMGRTADLTMSFEQHQLTRFLSSDLELVAHQLRQYISTLSKDELQKSIEVDIKFKYMPA